MREERRILTCAVAGFFLLTGCELAFAATNDAGTEGGADNSSSTALAEITVTEQKRSENLQDVPISVTVITSTSLEKNHAQIDPTGLELYIGASQMAQIIETFMDRQAAEHA
jgi:outer membrane receptor protein involved in Fe transport